MTGYIKVQWPKYLFFIHKCFIIDTSKQNCFFPHLFSEKAHTDPTAGLCALTQMNVQPSVHQSAFV